MHYGKGRNSMVVLGCQFLSAQVLKTAMRGPTPEEVAKMTKEERKLIGTVKRKWNFNERYNMYAKADGLFVDRH